MTPLANDDWTKISCRNARSVQTTIGWIFWDPDAVARYEARGLLPGLGYIAARAAPFAAAGPEALIAAFGSISPEAIRFLYSLLTNHQMFLDVWEDRNLSVISGLHEFAPSIIGPLYEFGPKIWRVVESLPTVGRPFSASLLEIERPQEPALSGWHAVNYLREWRGDTHWALVASSGLSAGEASILHNAWLGYEGDWLSLSRGNSPESIESSWRSLESKGLATKRTVNDKGIELRQFIEDETDRLTTLPWKALGLADSLRFAEVFEPPCEELLARVDLTAGTNFQPASRIRAS